MLDGKEWRCSFSLSLMVLEPIDQFIKDLLNVGTAPVRGLTNQHGQRYLTQRPFELDDVRLPREVAEVLLLEFDRLVFEIDRGEHKDLVASLDRLNAGGALLEIQLMPAGGGESPSTQKSHSNGHATLGQGVPRSEILAVFPPLKGQTQEQWNNMLSDPPKWLKPARISAGRPGVSALWNPAQFAMYLERKRHMGRGQLGAIIRDSFREYLEEWKAYAGSFD